MATGTKAKRDSRAIAIQPLTKRKAWAALKAHYKTAKAIQLKKLFDRDPKRGEKFSAEAVGIYLDYSKNRITEKTLKLLLDLAKESGLRERIDAMFRGDKINITENRAVLHVALRAPKDETILVDGKNVVPEVHAVLDKMSAFLQSRAQRGMEGPYRQAHPERDQHRHRRLRSRPGDGVRSAEVLQRPQHDVPLCFQCRWNGFRGGCERPGCRRRHCSSFLRRLSPRSKP